MGFLCLSKGGYKMPWLTPKTDWIPADGVTNADMNRWEGNIKYLREENKIINGTTAFTSPVFVGSTSDSGQYFQVRQSTRAVGGYFENNYTDVPSDVRGIVVNNIGTTQGELFRGRSNSINRVIVLGTGQVLIGDNPISNSVDTLEVGYDSDSTAGIGRSRIGGTSDIAWFSHVDQASSFSTRGFTQSSLGETTVNALLGQTLRLQNDNLNIVNISGIQVELLKPTIIGSSSDTGQYFQVKNSEREVSAYIENNYTTIPADGIGLTVNSISSSSTILKLRSASSDKVIVNGAGRVLIDTNPVDNGEDLVQAGSDKDESFTFGRCRFGFGTGTADQSIFAHIDNFNSTDYGLLLAENGTNLNAKSGGTVRLRINNASKLEVTGNNVNISARTLINTTDDTANDLQVGGSARIDGGLTLDGELKTERRFKATSTTLNNLFDNLSPWVPNAGDTLAITGQLRVSTLSFEGFVVGCTRVSSTIIWITAMKNDSGASSQNIVVNDGSATTVEYMNIKSIMTEST